jgi:hypothetical protein
MEMQCQTKFIKDSCCAAQLIPKSTWKIGVYLDGKFMPE